MKEYLQKFLVDFDYPKETHKSFLDGFELICSNHEYFDAFNSLLKRYSDDMMCDYVKLVDDAMTLADSIGVHQYTMRTILHIFMAEILKGFYKQKGIPESYWYDSMLDIKYQTLTTYVETGICGASCGYWFIFFFQLKRFSFGRLQIEYIPFNREYKGNGIELNKDSYVFNVHIPKTGTRLDINECHLSYERAMDFYEKYYAMHGDEIAGLCQHMKHFQVFLAGMAGNMNIGNGIVEDSDSLFEELVYDLGHKLFVSGNCGGGNNNKVIFRKSYFVMVGICHAVKSAHRLSLASGGDKSDLLGLVFFDIGKLNESAFGNVHVSETGCNINDVEHTSAGHCDLPSVAVRAVYNLLNTVNI